MAKVFISYRRADSAGPSGRIYDHLINRFGKQNIFKDVDDIPLGVNFATYIQQSLAECAVALVVIGRSWLDARDQAGNRRLDDPGDFVRLEIETAQRLRLTVIPVLVEGAAMPAAADLPTSLQPLARINAIGVRNDPDFTHDMERLIAGLERQLGFPPAQRPSTPIQTPADVTGRDKSKRGPVRSGLLAGIAALLVVVSLGAVFATSRGLLGLTPNPTPTHGTGGTQGPTPIFTPTTSTTQHFLAGITVTTASSGPTGITRGPDGAIWFTELTANKIGRVTTAGMITNEYPIPTASSAAQGITSGPDNNLWFTENNKNQIGRITPTGSITEYPLHSPGSYPFGITRGPDDNLWFTELYGNRVGRITPTGNITEYQITTVPGIPWSITSGPDGNLWFTELSSNKIGRITPTGNITGEYTIPTANSAPEGITSGPDGNLWFVEAQGNKIGRITPTGSITEYSIPTAKSKPQDITRGPNGNLWFVETQGNTIGQITPAGNITEYPIPIANGSVPLGITSGPDGNLWFTENGANAIGRIAP